MENHMIGLVFINPFARTIIRSHTTHNYNTIQCGFYESFRRKQIKIWNFHGSFRLADK